VHAEYEEDGSPDLSTIKPLIDGGTEGFKGHARVLLPGVTPCFECTLWLFPPQTKFPLCTLAETPRSAPHCVEYVKIVLWPRERPDDEFDADNEEHMKWVYDQVRQSKLSMALYLAMDSTPHEHCLLNASQFPMVYFSLVEFFSFIFFFFFPNFLKACARASRYGIQGVTLQLTQGVVKNIIPAIASTNALVAAACALEALKLVTMCSAGLNNYMMYSGTDSVYTLTSQYEKDGLCPVCSPGIPLHVPRDATLAQVLDAMLADSRLGTMLNAPSLSHGSKNLYVRGALEETTRPNLEKTTLELVGGEDAMAKGVVLTVNDKKLAAPLRVRLYFKVNGEANGSMVDDVMA
jgi:NEDD8-activating enzyme E1